MHRIREKIAQVWSTIQGSLFPFLEEELGPLTQAHQKVAQVLEDERGCIARAFVAKAVLNLATTRVLLERLASDAVLRRLTSCLDFRFWIPYGPAQSKTQNLKSKIRRPRDGTYFPGCDGHRGSRKARQRQSEA